MNQNNQNNLSKVWLLLKRIRKFLSMGIEGGVLLDLLYALYKNIKFLKNPQLVANASSLVDVKITSAASFVFNCFLAYMLVQKNSDLKDIINHVKGVVSNTYDGLSSRKRKLEDISATEVDNKNKRFKESTGEEEEE